MQDTESPINCVRWYKLRDEIAIYLPRDQNEGDQNLNLIKSKILQNIN